MNYFKDKDGVVYAYDDEQVYAGYGKGMAKLSKSEVEEIENPAQTDAQMKDRDIANWKLFLANTDWIVAKIGESSALGLDTKPLLDQYAEQLERREQARRQIRIAEGRL